MVNINGINEILVINPKANKMAQKNSAKIAACNEMAGPKPIGSLKVSSLELNSAIFGQPWVMIIKAETNLKINKPKSGKKDVVEKKSFFIF